MESKEDKENNSIQFFYKFVEGICPKSFGIQVAKLAGIPDNVLARATQKSDEMAAVLIELKKGLKKGK